MDKRATGVVVFEDTNTFRCYFNFVKQCIRRLTTRKRDSLTVDSYFCLRLFLYVYIYTLLQ